MTAGPKKPAWLARPPFSKESRPKDDKSAPLSVEANLGATLLVGNPTSRGGMAQKRIETARQLLKKYNIDHEFRSTVPHGGTSTMVADAISQSDFDTIIALGGDGTFNEVAKGICQSGRPSSVTLGMLPSGTANDQGKSFGLSATERALEENIRVLAQGHTTWLDVGEVEAIAYDGSLIRRDLFFDSIGWGLSAAILAFRNSELELIREVPVVRDIYKNQLVYVRATVHELALSWVTRDRFSVELTIDDEQITLDDISDLVISNTAIYAGEWIVDPTSAHDDGKFEICPFRGIRDWTSKGIINLKKNPLTEDMLNKIGVHHTPVFHGSRIRVQLLQPLKEKQIPAQIDGEQFSPAEYFDIVAHPKLIRLIVPRNFHWI